MLLGINGALAMPNRMPDDVRTPYEAEVLGDQQIMPITGCLLTAPYNQL